MGTPQKVLTPQGTPKSILKRRQIIEDNIRVESQYPHTPTNKATPKHKGLNYSYSDVDDLKIASENSRRETEELMQSRPKYSDATNGSFIEEMELTPKPAKTAAIVKKASQADKCLSEVCFSG